MNNPYILIEKKNVYNFYPSLVAMINYVQQSLKYKIMLYLYKYIITLRKQYLLPSVLRNDFLKFYYSNLLSKILPGVEVYVS